MENVCFCTEFGIVWCWRISIVNIYAKHQQIDLRDWKAERKTKANSHLFHFFFRRDWTLCAVRAVGIKRQIFVVLVMRFDNPLLAGSIYCRFNAANDRQSFRWCGTQINNKSIESHQMCAHNKRWIFRQIQCVCVFIMQSRETNLDECHFDEILATSKT